MNAGLQYLVLVFSKNQDRFAQEPHGANPLAEAGWSLAPRVNLDKSRQSAATTLAGVDFQ